MKIKFSFCKSFMQLRIIRPRILILSRPVTNNPYLLIFLECPTNILSQTKYQKDPVSVFVSETVYLIDCHFKECSKLFTYDDKVKLHIFVNRITCKILLCQLLFKKLLLFPLHSSFFSKYC